MSYTENRSFLSMFTTFPNYYANKSFVTSNTVFFYNHGKAISDICPLLEVMISPASARYGHVRRNPEFRPNFPGLNSGKFAGLANESYVLRSRTLRGLEGELSSKRFEVVLISLSVQHFEGYFWIHWWETVTYLQNRLFLPMFATLTKLLR